MLFEDVTDDGIRDVVTKVGQRALDPIESPGRILLGETNDQVNNHLANPSSPKPSLNGIVSLIGDQQSVPS